MGKSKGENTKKAAGNAKKAANAEEKAKQEQAKLDAIEDAKWQDGAKGKNKKEIEAEKKAEQARKKQEREAQLAAEEEELPSKGKQQKQRGAAKVAAKRTGKIDDFVAGMGNKDDVSLSASNVEDAIDALDISSGKSSNNKEIDRHPERRVKAAFAAFQERRLPELKKEQPGMRLNQYKDICWKEFQKSDENPFNQVTVAYNASREEVDETKKNVKKGKEIRLQI